MKKIAQFLRRMLTSNATLVVAPQQLKKPGTRRLVIGGNRFYEVRHPREGDDA